MTPEEHENRELDRLIRRLDAERPVPRAAFRGELRRHLLESLDARPAPPRRLRLLIAAYGGSGLALLAIAAIGVAGTGPFAAG
jgi:hypothetical protein